MAAAEAKKYDYSNNGKEYGKSTSYVAANDEFNNKGYHKEEFVKDKAAAKSEAWKHDKFESLERGDSLSPDPRKQHRDSHNRR